MCCAYRLVVIAADVVAFVAADVVVGVVLVVHFYVFCIVVDIAVVLPEVSGFLLEAVDIFFDVVGVLVFVFIVLSDAFGALLNDAAFFFLLLVVVFLLMVRAFLLMLLANLWKFSMLLFLKIFDNSTLSFSHMVF